MVDPNKVVNQRKRSSLRNNKLFTEPKEAQDILNAQKNKSLKWDVQVEENHHRHLHVNFKEDQLESVIIYQEVFINI